MYQVSIVADCGLTSAEQFVISYYSALMTRQVRQYETLIAVKTVYKYLWMSDLISCMIYRWFRIGLLSVS